MDIKRIEEAAELFFRMIEKHPELCPHYFEWEETLMPIDGKKLVRFKCKYCSEIFTKEYDMEDYSYHAYE